MKYAIDIDQCIEVLKKGGTILYPTDTVWGIGCDASNEQAIEKLYRIKQRNPGKSMIILLADEADIPSYTRQRNVTVYDYIKGIRKPVTVIYSDAIHLPANLINSDGSIGIRVVKDDFCRELIRRFGKPLVSTSSNVSGYPPPAFFSDIDNQIKDAVDYIVRHRQDDEVPGEPSTVIRLHENGQFDVIRP
jgi:L-threonylcarbamoyladenylate synthase